MGNNKYGKHVFRYNVAYILDLVFTCIAVALWLVSGIVILQFFKGVEPRVWVALVTIPLGALFFLCHEYTKLTMDIELNCMKRIDIQNEIDELNRDIIKIKKDMADIILEMIEEVSDEDKL